MKQFVIAIIFSVLYTASYSQQNYLKGYVITLVGDTLKGNVNALYWSSNPKEIEFKDGEGTNYRFEPMDIREFFVYNTLYKSFHTRYDSTRESIDEMSRSSFPTYKVANLFLKVILASKYSLLELKEDNNRVHYFIQVDSTVEELVDHEFMVNNNEVYTMRKNKLYIGQLRARLSDCEKLLVSDNLPYKKTQ